MLGWLTLLLLTWSPPAEAPPILGEAVDGREENYGGVYCGIYCLQAALAAQGRTVPPMEALQDVRYVTSFAGSSAADLIRAARDHGHELRVFAGLSIGTLRLAEGPVILHVRKEGFGNPYSHWVLFLGMEGEQARILDPPLGLELWDLGDVAAVWNGVGLMLQPPSGGWLGLFGYDLAANALLGATALACALSLRYLLGVWWATARVRRTLVEAAALVVLGVGLAAIWHTALPEGFWRNPTGLQLVRATYFQSAFPIVSTEEVYALLGLPEQRVVLVDARFPQAYARDHLPGAVNVPVNTPLQVLKRTQPVDLSATVIVYCESERCGWSDVVAHKLQILGGRDVRIYRAGYRGWPIQEFLR